MELREVLGRRRSIRFLNPNKPVEPEKVQMMFEAARIASHWGNVQSLKAVAVFKNSAAPEVIDAVQAVVAGWQIKIAPVVIVWYVDPEMVEEQADRLRQLVDLGALGFGADKKDALETRLIPFFAAIKASLKSPGMNEIDCGQGIAQATLMAYEQGLGTCCLGSARGPAIMKAMGLPEHCRFLVMQTVGYPLEHWEAGGQRPRVEFERLFHLNTLATPFPRSEQVVTQLASDGFFTRPAPLPGREAELEFMKKALDLKGAGLL